MTASMRSAVVKPYPVASSDHTRPEASRSSRTSEGKIAAVAKSQTPVTIKPRRRAPIAKRLVAHFCHRRQAAEHSDKQQDGAMKDDSFSIVASHDTLRGRRANTAAATRATKNAGTAVTAGQTTRARSHAGRIAAVVDSE